MQNNQIFDFLKQYSLIDESEIELYSDRVRDRDDVQVYRCKRSGIIFLSRTDHLDDGHYREKSKFRAEAPSSMDLARALGHDDIQRRTTAYKNLVLKKAWLDIGTGNGAILDAMGPFAARCAGVEPQRLSREYLAERGHEVYGDISEVGDGFEVVSMFHVLEHIPDQLGFLKKVRSRFSSEGTMIVEVPHARDFLLGFVQSEAFRDFALWSEHLILHTRESLKCLMEQAGFRSVNIQGVQRFPLANHLHWILQGRPGGHNHWSFLRNAQLDAGYESMLQSLDQTDTLVAIAQ